MIFGLFKREKEQDRFLGEHKFYQEMIKNSDKENEELKEQLTNKELEELDNTKPGRIFPDRVSFVKWQNMEMRYLIDVRKLKLTP